MFTPRSLVIDLKVAINYGTWYSCRIHADISVADHNSGDRSSAVYYVKEFEMSIFEKWRDFVAY